ncbi:hypothetical protein RHSIM_Rhsim04G0064500 [Rhododendron simsii]|uniref:F-box domain-containing protein n=1 Tax=Rhododendron simsii TaxID=118357 RepID=A0A834H5L7_RHOSS|nr:hypothetical protein RHSIM_Rhsim04G0064500 [Rhododendron simsii]
MDSLSGKGICGALPDAPGNPCFICNGSQMTRTRASTKRKKSLTGATPTVQSPAADNAHEPPPAANAIGCSVDLLTEILLRSPAKSLIRFKCVSKNWLSLISDSQFSRNHSRRNPRANPISGLYFYNRSRLKSVSFHGEQNLPSLPFFDVLGCHENLTSIVDSCNGLLLCENLDFDGKEFVAQYIVCNVSTQKYRVLPKPTGNSARWINHRAFLAFDPSKPPHYKVVLVSYLSPPPYEINVFFSRTGCWKKVFAQHTCHGPSAYWNGAIHWVGHENCLRFDVDTEEMIATPNRPLPKILSQDKIRYLGECGGRLFLIQSRSRKVLGFRILELCGTLWGSFQVNLRPIISAFSEIETTFEFDVLSLLCVGDVEKKENFTLVLAIPGRIIAYNLHRKTCDVLCNLSEDDFIERGRNGFAYPFVETLSPV